MSLSSVINFAKTHPVPVAIGVFVGGLVLYLLLARQSAPASDNGAGAYYAAQAAQAGSDASLAIAQANANAAVALGLDNNATSIAKDTIWADVSKTNLASNNATAVSLAPYQLQGQIVTAIGELGNAAPLTNTTSKGASGFNIGGSYGGIGGLLGITKGGKSSSTQTVNPAVIQALNQLQMLSQTYSAPH